MARPYWSGQIRISLVSFGVSLFPATEAKSEIRFHQLSRKTGERVRYQKTASDDTAVTKDDIVKGYEYRKGEYVRVEPEEIENLRIPSRKTLEVTQFVDADGIDPEYFEKPYFVTPEDKSQAEAFAVVRKALQETKKLALGKIAFGGREHVVAIGATDDEVGGMMAYTMRYAEELRKPADYFAEIKKVDVDEDQLGLAKELIQRKAAKFAPEKFRDEYEAALRAMVEAKVSNAPLPADEESSKSSGKVVSLMDALRKSVQSDAVGEEPKKVAEKPAAPKRGIVLVKSSAAKVAAPHAKAKRKSA